MTQELKERMNQVSVEGILSENRLDFRSLESGKAVGGDLLIQVSESNIVPVNFFTGEQKRDGTKSKLWDPIITIKDSYKSVADHGVEGADKVRINNGQLQSNEFYNAAGNLISTFRVRSNFANRVTGEFNPHVDFQVEIFIQAMGEEIEKEEPTGRLFIKGVFPGFRGRINLLTFLVEDAEGIKYIQDNYTEGDTVKIAGTINNTIQKFTKTEEMEFGDDIVNTFERVRRELIVARGSKPYDEESAFPVDLIKQALVQREADLKAAKDKAMSGQSSGPAKTGGGFGSETRF